jgi:hypothetical protein
MDEVPIKNKTNQDHGLVHGLNIKNPVISRLIISIRERARSYSMFIQKVTLPKFASVDFVIICVALNE